MTRATTATMAATETATPAYPGAALDAAIAAARIASPLVTGKDGALHAMVPQGFDLKALPDSAILPPRPKAAITVDDRASLIAYANRFSLKSSVLIADFDKGTINARLDWHPVPEAETTPGPSGADTHNVTLKLRWSEEFARWNDWAGKLHEQEDFARFLEENSSDVGFPEAAVMVEISRDFEATVGQAYKSSVRLENGDRRMVFESATRALQDVVVPQKFTLSIPIYNGEEPDTLTCLFRWRAGGDGKVRLGFEWHRVEYQRRAHFQAIAYAAAEATGLPVFMGRQA